MTANGLFRVETNQEAIAALGVALQQTTQHIRENMKLVKLDIPNVFGPDWIEAALKRQEEELALRRDQAANLTRAARVYGYRDAKVVWLQDPEQFAFIHLDGLVCANIPQIGEDYESALRWIREEANDQ